MGITKIPFELISGFYQDYKKRKPGFYRDYEKPRKKAMGFYKDSKKSTKKLFGDSDIFFRDSSGFFGILLFFWSYLQLCPPPAKKKENITQYKKYSKIL